MGAYTWTYFYNFFSPFYKQNTTQRFVPLPVWHCKSGRGWSGERKWNKTLEPQSYSIVTEYSLNMLFHFWCLSLDSERVFWKRMVYAIGLENGKEWTDTVYISTCKPRFEELISLALLGAWPKCVQYLVVISSFPLLTQSFPFFLGTLKLASHNLRSHNLRCYFGKPGKDCVTRRILDISAKKINFQIQRW